MKSTHDLTKTCTRCLVSPAEPGRTTCYACKLARAARARENAGLPPLDAIPEPTPAELEALEAGEVDFAVTALGRLLELVDMAVGWSKFTVTQQAVAQAVYSLPNGERAVVVAIAGRLADRASQVFDDLRRSTK